MEVRTNIHYQSQQCSCSQRRTQREILQLANFLLEGKPLTSLYHQNDLKKQREKMWSGKSRKCTLFEKGSILRFILSSRGRRGIFLRFAATGFLFRFVRARVASIRLHFCAQIEFENEIWGLEGRVSVLTGFSSILSIRLEVTSSGGKMGRQRREEGGTSRNALAKSSILCWGVNYKRPDRDGPWALAIFFFKITK